MSTYIALLRAINVGGHTVKMDVLRQHFLDMGFGGVRTYIASGNVIFDCDEENTKLLEEKIETYLHQVLGYEVATFIRATDQIRAIAEYQPVMRAAFELKEATVYVGFLKGSLEAEAEQKIMAFKTSVDDFYLHGSELYWLCRTKSMESKFSLARLEKTLKQQATFRNISTVKKLTLLYGR